MTYVGFFGTNSALGLPMGWSFSDLASAVGWVPVLIYLVFSYILVRTVFDRLGKGRFELLDQKFRPPTVPLRRLIRGRGFVGLFEIEAVKVHLEPEGPRLAYVRLRDGSVLMLREAEGVPVSFIDELAARWGIRGEA
ncbi:MAG TPA: hypothetical protein VEL81_05260 [Thermoplasmata archaeon]|nr:hypothetical protein [Thermoplasmata archaeon]